MEKLATYIKKISRAFNTVNTQVQNMKEAESNLYYSEDEDEVSNFQMADIDVGKSNFQFAHLDKKV